MDRIRLSVPMSVNNENGIEECPGVLMVLFAPAIRAMISRIEKVKAIKQEDPDVFSLTRHTFGLTVFDRLAVSDLLDNVDLFAEEIVELTPEQYDVIATADEKGASIRVECRQEHYLDDGVYFTALVKHTSIEIESQCLLLTQLEQYLARLDQANE